MRKNNIKISLGVLLASMLIFACSKKFLERDPLGSLNPGTLANSAGVQKLLIGAYSLLDGFGGAGGGWQSAGSNWVYGSVAGDDSYKGSDAGDQPDIVPIETYSPTSTNGYFNQKWQAVYDAIQRCNDVLRVMAEATDMSETEKLQVEAQVRFLRGHYHFEAKKMWKNVPYVDETITYADKNYNIPNTTDIWPNIEADLQFAAENLPETWTSVGRANNWAARAFLAKAYVFQAKWAEARTLLTQIIQSGVTAGGRAYALVPFGDNFNAETKNSAEAVFSVQQSVNDNSNGSNGGWGDVLNFPYNGGPGGCCGFNQPSQSLVNSFRVDANGLPFIDNFNAVDVKNDDGLKSDQAFTPETLPLDPRLDWTVGRRGIPYLDWGPHPGNNWIRDQNYSGPYAPKKNVYYQRQAGALTDKSFWTSGVTANNYTFIRFSDVLLWAAEAEVEVGDLNVARQYVNRVRSRAADPTGWVKNPDGSNAANYSVGLYNDPWTDKVVARNAVRFERKLELAMEGHRFFDLVRYGIADVELNAHIAKEKVKRTFFNNATFRKGTNEYFPIPQEQIDRSLGTLVQNPGY